MSDTPRTDAVFGPTVFGERAKTCRELEKELKAANQRAEKRYCLWDFNAETGLYFTECMREHFFDLRRKRDAPFKFCPFCGGIITAM